MWYRGMVREDALQRTCNNEIRGNYSDNFKCHFLHHFNPYLKLCPFKLEVKLDKPYRIILHDMLTEEEIQHILNLSIPNLSRTRRHSPSNDGSKSESEGAEGPGSATGRRRSRARSLTGDLFSSDLLTILRTGAPPRYKSFRLGKC